MKGDSNFVGTLDMILIFLLVLLIAATTVRITYDAFQPHPPFQAVTWRPPHIVWPVDEFKGR